jgi:hypothetical protein
MNANSAGELVLRQPPPVTPRLEAIAERHVENRT